MNVEIGTEAGQSPEKEYIKCDFPCSAEDPWSMLFSLLYTVIHTKQYFSSNTFFNIYSQLWPLVIGRNGNQTPFLKNSKKVHDTVKKVKKVSSFYDY